MGGKGHDMQYEAVLLFVSGVMPPMRPHTAIYLVFPTCFASFVCPRSTWGLYSSVASAGNGRHSSSMTPAQSITSDAQDVAKRWKKMVYLHV